MSPNIPSYACLTKKNSGLMTSGILFLELWEMLFWCPKPTITSAQCGAVFGLCVCLALSCWSPERRRASKVHFLECHQQQHWYGLYTGDTDWWEAEEQRRRGAIAIIQRRIRLWLVGWLSFVCWQNAKLCALSLGNVTGVHNPLTSDGTFLNSFRFILRVHLGKSL